MRNAEVNARSKSLKKENLRITHIAVNRARPGKRRTYRAHGRINPFNSHPCHVELFIEEKAQFIPKSIAKAQFRKNRKILRSQLDRKTRKDMRHAIAVMKIHG